MSAPGHSEPAERPRRHPRTIGGVIFLGVVGMAGVGVALIVAGPWRTGVAWMGAGVLAGGFARAVLSERSSGMLRVRRRWTDVLTMLVAGSTLIVLAVVVPDQPV